jgi:3-oxoacyl-(acyl-carrier-protein) synthase
VERSVAITGLGVVTTLGDSPAAFREGLLAGRSGITRWTQMDPRIDSKIGGDLNSFDAIEHLAKCPSAELAAKAKKLLRVTPFTGRIGACAALDAFLDAGLQPGALEPERFGHVLAGHNLNQGFYDKNGVEFAGEPTYIDPLYGLVALDTDVLSVSSELLNVKGPSFTIGGACASGNLGVMAALDLLRAGRADQVLVTGSTVDLDPMTLQGWCMLDALSIKSFNDDPAHASRPFDKKREGFVPSHGAAALLLETMESARRRGARIRARVLGASSASDASRLTKPNRDGQVRAIRQALRDAEVSTDQVDYVNAHATSTPLGDAIEVDAIRTALGDRARQIPVNATKSMIGHCLTAAGAVELAAVVVQIEAGAVHPTINQEEKDPELDLDFVPNTARQHRIRVAISNSFGFGGINSCVVVGAP